LYFALNNNKSIHAQELLQVNSVTWAYHIFRIQVLQSKFIYKSRLHWGNATIRGLRHWNFHLLPFWLVLSLLCDVSYI